MGTLKNCQDSQRITFYTASANENKDFDLKLGVQIEHIEIWSH